MTSPICKFAYIFSKLLAMETFSSILIRPSPERFTPSSKNSLEWAQSDKPGSGFDHKLFPSSLQSNSLSEIWRVSPTYTAIHHVLTNPVYAGACVYGKIQQERYVPMVEATKILGVSCQTVFQRVKRGELSAVHVRRGRQNGLRIRVLDILTSLFDNLS